MSETRRPQAGKTIAQVVGALAGTSLGLPLQGEPLIAQYVSSVATPLVAQGVDSFIEAARRRFLHRNTEGLLGVASAEVGESTDDTIRRLVDSPELLGMLVDAIKSVEATNSAEKVLLFGRTLAAAANDLARIDEEWFFLDRLGRLEAAHIRVVSGFRRRRKERAKLIKANGGQLGNNQLDAMSALQLSERTRIDPLLVRFLVDDLEAAGFLLRVDAKKVGLVDFKHRYDDEPQATREPDGTVRLWALTFYGRQLLDRLALAADPLDDPAPI